MRPAGAILTWGLGRQPINQSTKYVQFPNMYSVVGLKVMYNAHVEMY